MPTDEILSQSVLIVEDDSDIREVSPATSSGRGVSDERML